MKQIIVCDSGIGGLSVFSEINKLLPSAPLVYFADKINFPYGQKSQTRLVEIAIQNYKFLSGRYDIGVFVIACNTLTAAAIDTLRKEFPDQNFVGCEPPIKQAVEFTKSRALVLLTEASCASHRLQNRFACEKTIFLPMPRLAELVECGAPYSDICAYVQRRTQCAGQNFDCVALGCTHYSLIKANLEKIFAPLPVFDAAAGVARQAVKLFLEKDS